MTTYAINASFISEIAVLIMWALLPPYAYFTFKESGHSTRKALAIGVAMLLWGAWAFGAVKYQLDDVILGWLPVSALKVPVYWFVIVTIAFVGRRWFVGNGLSQRWLLGLQTFRVIGAVFLIEYARGTLPGSFAIPAGIGDILAAVFAMIVLVWYRNRPIPNAALWFVIIFGMLDFASAVFFGVTSAEVPFQLFAFNNPNEVGLYPTGLIPFYGVPYAILFHLFSIFEMQRVARQRPSRVSASHSLLQAD